MAYSIINALAALNPNYDPSPGADNRQWAGVTDGMVYGTIAGTTKWWHIDAAMIYDGSAWRVVNPAAVQPSVTMSDASACDPRGNAPTYMPRYSVQAALSGGTPGIKVAVYWWKNGVYDSADSGGIFTMPDDGTSTVYASISPTETEVQAGTAFRCATTAWSYMQAQPAAPSAPTSATIIPNYLACGRPV